MLLEERDFFFLFKKYEKVVVQLLCGVYSTEKIYFVEWVLNKHSLEWTEDKILRTVNTNRMFLSSFIYFVCYMCMEIRLVFTENLNENFN